VAIFTYCTGLKNLIFGRGSIVAIVADLIRPRRRNEVGAANFSWSHQFNTIGFVAVQSIESYQP
jgi:hypothetical protein